MLFFSTTYISKKLHSNTPQKKGEWRGGIHELRFGDYLRNVSGVSNVYSIASVLVIAHESCFLDISSSKSLPFGVIVPLVNSLNAFLNILQFA